MTPQTTDYLRAHREDAPDVIAAALTGDVFLAQGIPFTQLASDYLTRGWTQRMDATRAHPACPADLKAGVSAFQTFMLMAGFTILDTASHLDAATMTDQVLSGLVAFRAATGDLTVGFSQAESDYVRSLGGGYRYDRLTVQQVTDALVTINYQASLQDLRDRARDAYNATVAQIDALTADAPAPPPSQLTTWFKAVAEA